MKTQGNIHNGRVFLYIRYSSDEQKDGDSEDRQLRKAKLWVKTNERPIFKTFYDRGVSSFRGDNRTSGQFSAMLAEAKDGDTILIENQDRFGRDGIVYALPHLHKICERGIAVIFLDGNTVTTRETFNHDGVLLTNVLAFFRSNKESARKNDLIGEAWRKNKQEAANGVIITASCPAWLDVVYDGKKRIRFEPNSKAEAVRRIFKEYANGKGIREIVRGLNQDNVPTHGRGKQSKGNGWAATHVRRILGYRQVIGEYQPCFSTPIEGTKQRLRKPDGKPIPDYYKPIIDKTLFYKVQSMLPKGTGKKGKFTGGLSRGRTGNATNLFTEIVKCKHCGGAMIIKHSGEKKQKYRYTYYSCDKANRGSGCSGAKIQSSHVERAVLTVLFSKVMPEMGKQDNKAETLIVLQGELKVIRDRLAELEKIQNEIPTMSGAKSIAQHEAKVKQLAEQVEIGQAALAESPLEGWKPIGKTLENRLRLRLMLKEVIQSIVIDAKGREAILNVKDPICSFKFTWESKNGNHLQKDAASLRFTMEGKGLPKMQSPYLDEFLVWESEYNKGKLVEIKEAA